jgi:hypothetical protein
VPRLDITLLGPAGADVHLPRQICDTPTLRAPNVDNDKFWVAREFLLNCAYRCLVEGVFGRGRTSSSGGFRDTVGSIIRASAAPENPVIAAKLRTDRPRTQRRERIAAMLMARPIVARTAGRESHATLLASNLPIRVWQCSIASRCTASLMYPKASCR